MTLDSGGNLILIFRHPQWSITWAWKVSWTAKNTERFFYAYRICKYRRGLYGVLKIGRLRFERQPTMKVER